MGRWVIFCIVIHCHSSNQDAPFSTEHVEVLLNHSQANFTFRDLDSGAYEVTVASGAGSVFGAETSRANFVVDGKQTSTLSVRSILIGALFLSFLFCRG